MCRVCEYLRRYCTQAPLITIHLAIEGMQCLFMAVVVYSIIHQQASQKTQRQTDAKAVTIDKPQGHCRHAIAKISNRFPAPVDVLTV